MTRPTREPGRKTRAALREVALAMFIEHGFDQVTMTAIASRIGGYANQVTHHFGSKDALFAETSGLAVLRAARQAEQAALHADSIESHARILVASLLGPGAPSVMMFAEAMLMARNKAVLRPIIRGTLDRLHTVGEATLIDTLTRHRWTIRTSPEVVTRAFWASVLGLALEKAAAGDAFEYRSAEAVALSMMNLNQGYAGEGAS